MVLAELLESSSEQAAKPSAMANATRRSGFFMLFPFFFANLKRSAKKKLLMRALILSDDEVGYLARLQGSGNSTRMREKAKRR